MFDCLYLYDIELWCGRSRLQVCLIPCTVRYQTYLSLVLWSMQTARQFVPVWYQSWVMYMQTAGLSDTLCLYGIGIGVWYIHTEGLIDSWSIQAAGLFISGCNSSDNGHGLCRLKVSLWLGLQLYDHIYTWCLCTYLWYPLCSWSDLQYGWTIPVRCLRDQI